MHGITEKPDLTWRRRQAEVQALAAPLLQARAVQRLDGVTFLGILSPHFRDRIESPLWPSAMPAPVTDGTRYDHTLGVAFLALDLARRFDFSERGQRYAAAWGLTHDVATWPLSHTGEPVFAALTGVSPRILRAGMLQGSANVPERYRLAAALRDLDLDPAVLASLFDRGSTPAGEELALFHQVLHSPLTPDTLEGMWRSGAVFGIPVMSPEVVVAGLRRSRAGAYLDRRSLPTALDFWKGKSAVYERFINRDDVVGWESAWAMALQAACHDTSLADSLELKEDDLVRAVNRRGVTPTSRLLRYKEPQEYVIHVALDALPSEPPVSELWKVLGREPAGVSPP